MNYVFYAGVVAFGALTLVIEARRNYSVSAKHQPFEFYPILKSVKAENLCSAREWRFGRYIYSLLYLVSYAVLLMFSELYDVIREADLSQYMVGSTNTIVQPGQDPFNFADTNYGKPIFISAFIIAFYSLGATRNIELHIRTLAHRLAGVPRGVLTVIQRLQDPNFLGTTHPPSGPLLEILRSRLQELHFDVGSSLDLPDAPPKSGDPKQKPKPAPTGKKQFIASTARALRNIDCLYPCVVGGQRATHFPLLGLEELTNLSKTLKKEIDDLRNLIATVDPDDIDSLAKLQEEAILAANSARAVFAVYYIGNSRTILNVKKDSALDRITIFADRGYRVDQNSFVAAILLGFVVTIGFGIFNYMNFRTAQVEEDPGWMEAEYHAELISSDPQARFYFQICDKSAGRDSVNSVQKEQCSGLDERFRAFLTCLTESAEAVFPPPERGACNVPFNNALLYQKCTYLQSGQNQTQPILVENSLSAEEQKPCEIAQEKAKKSYLQKNLKDFAKWSFWDAFATLLAVSAVVQMAIFERDIRKEQHTWREWTFARMPYVRLFTSSILPPLAGVIALASAFLLQLAWDMNFQVTSARIETLFLYSWPFFMACAAPFFVLSFAVYILMDKHESWPFLVTILAALIWAIIYILVNGFVIYMTTTPPTRPGDYLLSGLWRDTIQLSLLPSVFLVTFAIVLEWTEDADRRRVRKLIDTTDPNTPGTT